MSKTYNFTNLKLSNEEDDDVESVTGQVQTTPRSNSGTSMSLMSPLSNVSSTWSSCSVAGNQKKVSLFLAVGLGNRCLGAIGRGEKCCIWKKGECTIKGHSDKIGLGEGNVYLKIPEDVILLKPTTPKTVLDWFTLVPFAKLQEQNQKGEAWRVFFEQALSARAAVELINQDSTGSNGDEERAHVERFYRASMTWIFLNA